MFSEKLTTLPPPARKIRLLISCLAPGYKYLLKRISQTEFIMQTAIGCDSSSFVSFTPSVSPNVLEKASQSFMLKSKKLSSFS
jgi:hypothetical protein